MSNRQGDILIGTILMGVAVIWCVLVLATIPGGSGAGDVGPRAFPLLFGAMLGVFSAVLVVTRLREGRGPDAAAGAGAGAGQEPTALSEGLTPATPAGEAKMHAATIQPRMAQEAVAAESTAEPEAPPADPEGPGGGLEIRGAIAEGAEAAAGALQGPAGRRARLREWRLIGLTLMLIGGYGFALEKLGFNLATALIVALTLLSCVRERSWVRIAAMSIGVPLACWLIFGQILDIPLATGTWINLG